MTIVWAPQTKGCVESSGSVSASGVLDTEMVKCKMQERGDVVVYLGFVSGDGVHVCGVSAGEKYNSDKGEWV